MAVFTTALLALVLHEVDGAEPTVRPLAMPVAGGELIEVRKPDALQPLDLARTPPLSLAQTQPLPPPTTRPEMVRPTGQVPAPPQSTLAPPMFGPGQLRLPLLGEPEVVGATPRPSPQTVAQFERFVDPRAIQPENVLTLVEGRAYVLRLKQAPFRVQIDDRVVTADLITDRELSLTGLPAQQNAQSTGAPRATVLNLWFQDADAPDKQQVLSYLLQVVSDPESRERQERAYKRLEEEVNRLFPNSNVQLSLVGNRVAVRGEAKDIVEAAQIFQLVAANSPSTTNVEPLNVGNMNLFVNPTGGDANNISGTSEAVGLLESLAQRSPNLINLLRVSGEQQVMLKVTLAEVNRTAARAIGVNFSVTGDSGLTFASLPSAQALAVANPDQSGAIRFNPLSAVAPGSNFLVNRGDFQMAVNALSTMGLARTLAEPNLVTLNGQPATFRAGTDLAVQNLAGGQGVVLSGFAQVFAGITLRFTPLITDRDRVRLQMVAQVSAQSGTTAAGPNITQRTVQTSVELRDGQTLAIAGVLQTNYNDTSNRVPFLGDIPVLGRLFKSDTTSKTENELMIIVTPELVHPLECHERLPVPGSDTFEPSDVEFFIKGRLESLRSEDYRDPARTSWDRMQAYRRCENRFILGAHGYSDGK